MVGFNTYVLNSDWQVTLFYYAASFENSKYEFLLSDKCKKKSSQELLGFIRDTPRIE